MRTILVVGALGMVVGCASPSDRERLSRIDAGAADLERDVVEPDTADGGGDDASDAEDEGDASDAERDD